MTEFPVSEELADALTPLLAADLENYLEERALFRQLVAAGQHRGVKPPVKPRYRLERRTKSAEPRPAKAAARAPLLVRSFAAASVEAHGRELVALIVPYDRPARVSDGGGPFYEESWERGAFAEQLGRSAKVLVNFEHQQGIGGVVGHATELRDDDAGLVGTFQIHKTGDGDKALELVREGVLDGISLEAIALRSVREGGVVRRLQAKLRAVALCRNPAFPGARVLAVRGE